jgi:uncharacterized protein YneF (UPF0154 family)
MDLWVGLLFGVLGKLVTVVKGLFLRKREEVVEE